MTDEPAAILATFSDWRTVKGRKQLQLILEVPLEQQGDVLKYLGAPDAVNPKWCGIALVAAPAKRESASKPRSYAQRAAIACQQPTFRKFLAERFPHNGVTPGIDLLAPDIAADDVRSYCGVQSRNEIIEGTDAGNRWRDLHAEYEAWLKVPA